jgi:hypothetical protein
MERIWKEWIVAYVRYCTCIYMKGERNIGKVFSNVATEI